MKPQGKALVTVTFADDKSFSTRTGATHRFAAGTRLEGLPLLFRADNADKADNGLRVELPVSKRVVHLRHARPTPCGPEIEEHYLSSKGTGPVYSIWDIFFTFLWDRYHYREKVRSVYTFVWD